MRNRLNNLIALANFPAIAAALSACSSERPVNPSFPLTSGEAKAALKQMHRDAKPLARPVVVLGGIHDPGFAPSHIADVIRDSVPDAERSLVIDIAFFETWSFDACAEKLIRTVERMLPDEDAAATLEVDCVAFSMGGIVARYAASDEFSNRGGQRFRIARLFTISTPHSGASTADLPTFDSRAKAMRSDSEFLAALNARHDHEPYPLFAYVRLYDWIVGEEHAAPPGRTAWWVPRGFTLSHSVAARDRRILADILRRLRYEEPYSVEPAAPLPD